MNLERGGAARRRADARPSTDDLARGAPGPAGLLGRAVSHPMARQFLSFLAVGAVATAAHYAVLASLVELAGVSVIVSTSVGFVVGVVVSYVLNRRATFASQRPAGIEFAKYLGVFVVGLTLNGAIVASLQNLGVHYVISQPIATGIVLFWNFGASRFFVFRG